MSMKRVMAGLIVMLAVAGCEEGGGGSRGSGQTGGSPNSDFSLTSTDQAILDKVETAGLAAAAGQSMVGSPGSLDVSPLGDLNHDALTGSTFATTGSVDRGYFHPALSAASPEPLTATLSGMALVAMGLKVRRRASRSS